MNIVDLKGSIRSIPTEHRNAYCMGIVSSIAMLCGSDSHYALSQIKMVIKAYDEVDKENKQEFTLTQGKGFTLKIDKEKENEQ